MDILSGSQTDLTFQGIRKFPNLSENSIPL